MFRALFITLIDFVCLMSTIINHKHIGHHLIIFFHVFVICFSYLLATYEISLLIPLSLNWNVSMSIINFNFIFVILDILYHPKTVQDLLNRGMDQVYSVSDKSFRNFQILQQVEKCLTSNENHDNLPLY